MLTNLDTETIVISKNKNGLIITMGNLDTHLNQEESDLLLFELVRIEKINHLLKKIYPEPAFVRELRERGFKFGEIDHSWKPKDRNLI
jgi:hypothetical protein